MVDPTLFQSQRRFFRIFSSSSISTIPHLYNFNQLAQAQIHNKNPLNQIMRTLCSDVFLIDLRSSWHSVSQFPTSTLISVSSSFRRTRPGHKSIASLKSPDPSMWSPEIRRPSDRFPFGNGLGFGSPSIASTSQSTADTELEGFLELVPLRMRRELYKHEELGKLIEVVMDLGRKPIARFPSGDWIISEEPITAEDLGHAISKVGEFSDDNRSGIDSSLHRISAIRNRKKQIIGLTCRVGRALSGSADTFRDLVAGGGSILVVGPPGVGKTTMIREIARMLADEHRKRVIIVDTSNEIGGDGDVPHAGIGRARRMQVPNVHMQHNVMIEAVENHMPQTIIIDEIGTELEALAASTIAQRGVQLVGTAHGITIDNIIKNPCLQNLVGGIESVTLGDEEARKRKVQKTILERKGPPTFTCAVEMISKTECRVHHHLDASVDAILAGKSPMVEVRHMNSEIQDPPRSIELEKITVEETEPTTSSDLISNLTDKKNVTESDDEDVDYPRPKSRRLKTKQSVSKRSRPISVYIYEILEVELLEVATVMGLGDVIDATDDIAAADAILACSSEIKENPWIRGVAKLHQLPVFVIKSNTMAQMVKAIRMMLGIESYSSKLKQPATKKYSDVEIEDDAPERKPSLEEIDALEEVRLAIEYIVIPGGEPVELLPRRSDIVARQLELVESYQLEVENSGTESNPRLQILPLRRTKKTSSFIIQKETTASEMLTGGGATTVARLPLLPE